MLPFGNQLATVDLTGPQLLAVLEFDAALPRPAGGFLQVSGLNLVIDGDKISEVTVGGKPLQPDKTYRVATNDFCSPVVMGIACWPGEETPPMSAARSAP